MIVIKIADFILIIYLIMVMYLTKADNWLFNNFDFNYFGYFHKEN